MLIYALCDVSIRRLGAMMLQLYLCKRWSPPLRIECELATRLWSVSVLGCVEDITYWYVRSYMRYVLIRIR